MRNKKPTKKTVLCSMVVFILSFSMLLGTTYAWFMDSVSSGINRIQSGDLALELSHKGVKEEGEIQADTRLFTDVNGDDMLWEPGAKSAEIFTVANSGSLALKYQFSLLFSHATATPKGKTLADALKIRVATGEDNIEDSARGGRKAEGEVLVEDAALTDFTHEEYLLPGESRSFQVGICWKETEDDNDYNVRGGLSIDLGIQVVATQYSYESDMTDTGYDSGAEYPDPAPAYPVGAVFVETDDALAAAIRDSETKAIVVEGALTYDWGSESGADSKAPKGKEIWGLDEQASITFQGYGSANVIEDVALRNITIYDQTEGDDETSWEHGYLELRNLVAENVVFEDIIQLSGSCDLTECTFNNETAGFYALWMNQGSCSLTDCDFTGTRGVKIHDDSTEKDREMELTIADCEFTLSEKPGIVIGDLGAEAVVSITDSTFTCQAGDQDKYIYETDTDVAGFTFTESGNTVVSQ